MLGCENQLIRRAADEQMVLMRVRVAAMVRHALHDYDCGLAVEMSRMRPNDEAVGEAIVADPDLSERRPL